VSGPGDLNEAGARILPTIITLAHAARRGVQVVHCVKIFRRPPAREPQHSVVRRRGLVPNEPQLPDSRPVPLDGAGARTGRAAIVMTLHGMGAGDRHRWSPAAQIRHHERRCGRRLPNVGVTNTVMDP
jgi:hypothetical protein